MANFLDDNSFAPVTAILDSGGNQIFETVGVLSLSAASSKVYPQHTLENGVAITDHEFDLQDRVTLRCVLSPDDYVDVYQRIKKAFRQSVAFIIQTKVETYSNLYIETLPHEEDAKNTVLLSLDFVQQRFQSVRIDTLPSSSVANQADSDSQNAGNKRPSDTREVKKTTVLNDLLGGLL
jgi:hypothetical protein